MGIQSAPGLRARHDGSQLAGAAEWPALPAFDAPPFCGESLSEMPRDAGLPGGRCSRGNQCFGADDSASGHRAAPEMDPGGSSRFSLVAGTCRDRSGGMGNEATNLRTPPRGRGAPAIRGALPHNDSQSAAGPLPQNPGAPGSFRDGQSGPRAHLRLRIRRGIPRDHCLRPLCGSGGMQSFLRPIDRRRKRLASGTAIEEEGRHPDLGSRQRSGGPWPDRRDRVFRRRNRGHHRAPPGRAGTAHPVAHG